MQSSHLAALAAATIASLAGCARTPDAAPSARLALTQVPAERLELPAQAGLLNAGHMGTPLRDGPDQPEAWSWVLGRSARFDLPIGRPVSGELVVRARAARFFEQPLEITARIGNRELGTVSLGPKPQDLRFDLPTGSFAHSGRVEVELLASDSGRPSERVPGSEDGRELSFQVAAAHIEGADAPTHDGPYSDALLEPGEVATAALLVRDDTHLAWPFASDEPGPLWVGAHEVGSGQLLDWQAIELGPESRDVVPDLDGLEGRVIELSLYWAGARPLELPTPDYRPGGSQTDVVLIVVDTLRADHTFGDIPGLDTPNIARLRDDGIAFDATFSHAPMTLPSHTALFSSRYPQSSGVTNNWDQVPDDLPLLAEWLQRAGYTNRASISLGTLWSPLPGALLSRGFTEYTAEPEIERAESANVKLLPLLAKSAEERPFFLFCHYSDPHEPYNTALHPDREARVELPGAEPLMVPVGTWSREVYPLELEPGEHRVRVSSNERLVYLRRAIPRIGDKQLPVQFEAGELRKKLPEHVLTFTVPGKAPAQVDLELWIYDGLDIKEAPSHYREEVAYADRAVGRLLDALRELDLYDSSLIVFTSDHGESLNEHGHLGHARNLYDSEIHVPLVIKPPAGHAATARLSQASGRVVRHIDLVPTLLDLLDLSPLPGQLGQSILAGPAERHFAETHVPESLEDLYALRDARYKLIYAPEAGRFELYDVQADPRELNDLWAERGAEFEAWREELELLSLAHSAGNMEDMSPEKREQLRALGYLDDE